ncbi:hypothetical protein [Nesterenkonia jeotgali]|uniref:hypothetical protein n=1 Tax=Nesterenkonia jeotgali TaxID=317018 RepID=UPI001E5FFB88|nr:hypothetical protein [Nesterenkonia jeotgali]
MTVAACAVLSKGTKEPQGTMIAAGLLVSNREAADALIFIVHGLSSDHSTKPGRSYIRSALRLAYQVLEKPTLEEAATHAVKHRVLRGHLGHLGMITPAPKGIPNPAAYPIIQALFLESIRDQLPLTMHLTYQMESTWPRSPQGVGVPQPKTPVHFPRWGDPALPFHRVPQLFWVNNQEFTETDISDGGRFAVSLAICNIGRSMTLASMAESLGATKASARMVTKNWTRLAETSGWRSLQRRFIEMAEALHDEPPPIDYNRRRDVLPSPKALAALLTQLEVPETLGEDELLWTWSVSTQSSCNLIPPQHREDLNRHTTPRAPTARQLEKLNGALEAYFNEPLFWTPP